MSHLKPNQGHEGGGRPLFAASAPGVITVLLVFSSVAVAAETPSPSVSVPSPSGETPDSPTQPFLLRRLSDAPSRRWGSILVKGPGEDMRVYTGWITFTGGKRLVFQDPKAQKTLLLPPSRIAGIAVRVEKEQIEREWTWKGMGDDEKIFTGKTYPVRLYSFTVTTTSGGKMQGRFVGFPVYLTDEKGEKKRFVIRPRQKGAPGQKPADLSYVAGVAFHSPSASPPWKLRKKKAAPENVRSEPSPRPYPPSSRPAAPPED